MKNTKQTKCVTFNIELTISQFNRLNPKDIKNIEGKLESDVLKQVASRIENPYSGLLEISEDDDYSPF